MIASHSQSEFRSPSGDSPKNHGVVARVVSAISDEAAQAATAESQLTSAQVADVDAREEMLMAAHSPDGTPPEHWLRAVEWKWFRYLMITLSAGAVLWIAIGGVSAETVLMGIALLTIMAFAAAPVWGSAILRAREGREARAEAISEIQSTGTAGTCISGDRPLKSEPEVQVILVKKEDSYV